MQALLKTVAITMLAAGAAGAQMPSGIVDVFIVKVKPEKRGDFDITGRKVADANRKNKGDHWVAYSVEYGDQNTVIFSAVRDNLAAIDTATDAFMGAIKESYGPNFMKLFQDMNNCSTSSRAEVRRRRPDLSWNMPAGTPDIEKHVGGSKWLRYLTVGTRPGHSLAYEDTIKTLKAGFEKGPNKIPTFVSQSSAGQPSGVYYFTTFGKSLGDFDSPAGSPGLRELLGSSGYEQYQKSSKEDVLAAEWTIARIVPELSNPPDGIAAANPEFWRPKPAAAPKPAAKPKAPAAPKTGL